MVHFGYQLRKKDVLGKGVQQCRSLPSVALRSFLNGAQVSRNTLSHKDQL